MAYWGDAFETEEWSLALEPFGCFGLMATESEIPQL